MTILLPEALLREAQETTGEGVTATIQKGLELVAAGRTYRKLRRLRGKVKLSLDWKDLRRRWLI